MLNIPKICLLSICTFLCMASTSFAEISVARPPQFVLLAFDGSQSLSFWNESLTFAQNQLKNNKPLKFTYFISGVYFVDASKKNIYSPPHHKIGASDIGWGKRSELSARVNYVNLAYKEGHEIASHGNGHFDGSKWTESDWSTEFDSFNQMIFDLEKLNGIKAPLEISKEDVVGFRAPLLGYSKGLWPVMKKNGFSYDTSRTAHKSYWPKKESGIWNFPLAMLKIAGTAKNTLSMDYNFYVAQSKGVKDANPDNFSIYKKQMLDTYRAYFASNYYGNRAPIHIGHHFSKWNGGAYWSAMQSFASEVCGLPEVKCVTYRELEEYMEKLTPKEISAFENGQFPQSIQKDVSSLKFAMIPPALDIQAKLKIDKGIVSANFEGQDARNLAAMWYINGNKVAQGNSIDLNSFDLKKQDRISFSLEKNKIEVLSLTRVVEGVNKEGMAILSSRDIEENALLGDLPEAHK